MWHLLPCPNTTPLQCTDRDVRAVYIPFDIAKLCSDPVSNAIANTVANFPVAHDFTHG
jgi:hypothetical protein